MSERGDGGNGDLFGPDPDDHDPLWGPPQRQPDEGGPIDVPPIREGEEPTRVMPGGPGGGPAIPGQPDPGGAMPPVAGGPFEPGS